MVNEAKKRFTMTPDGGDRQRLEALAGRSNPAFSLPHVVNCATNRFRNEAEVPPQIPTRTIF